MQIECAVIEPVGLLTKKIPDNQRGRDTVRLFVSTWLQSVKAVTLVSGNGMHCNGQRGAVGGVMSPSSLRFFEAIVLFVTTEYGTPADHVETMVT